MNLARRHRLRGEVAHAHRAVFNGRGHNPVTSGAELEDLMERAKADARADAQFFSALLRATVYAHVPTAKRPGQARFMTFNRQPDGVSVVPFFTDEARARRSTQGMARVVAMRGRAFLEATRGSTLVLNPQDTPCCFLYPEEVAALLDEGYMAEVQEWNVDDGGSRVCSPPKIPAGLVEVAVAAVRDLAYVDSIYVAGIQQDQHADPTILLAVGGDAKFAERAARALATVLQRQASKFGTVVDMMHFDPGAPPPWIEALKLQPVYRRSARASQDTAQDLQAPN